MMNCFSKRSAIEKRKGSTRNKEEPDKMNLLAHVDVDGNCAFVSSTGSEEVGAVGAVGATEVYRVESRHKLEGLLVEYICLSPNDVDLVISGVKRHLCVQECCCVNGQRHLQLWDTERRKQTWLKDFEFGTLGRISLAKFSDNGSMFVALTVFREILLIRHANGQTTLSGPTDFNSDKVSCIKFSSCGSLVFFGLSCGAIRIQKLDFNAPLFSLPGVNLQTLFGHRDAIASLDILSGGFLMSTDASGKINTWANRGGATEGEESGTLTLVNTVMTRMPRSTNTNRCAKVFLYGAQDSESEDEEESLVESGGMYEPASQQNPATQAQSPEQELEFAVYLKYVEQDDLLLGLTPSHLFIFTNLQNGDVIRTFDVGRITLHRFGSKCHLVAGDIYLNWDSHVVNVFHLGSGERIHRVSVQEPHRVDLVCTNEDGSRVFVLTDANVVTVLRRVPAGKCQGSYRLMINQEQEGVSGVENASFHGVVLSLDGSLLLAIANVSVLLFLSYL